MFIGNKFMALYNASKISLVLPRMAFSSKLFAHCQWQHSTLALSTAAAPEALALLSISPSAHSPRIFLGKGRHSVATKLMAHLQTWAHDEGRQNKGEKSILKQALLRSIQKAFYLFKLNSAESALILSECASVSWPKNPQN